METHPHGGMNELLRQWREEMRQNPTFRQEDLEEMEVHLREAIEIWKGKGLNDLEAFMIASRRLGYQDQLVAEFNKAYSERRFLNPAA